MWECFVVRSDVNLCDIFCGNKQRENESNVRTSHLEADKKKISNVSRKIYLKEV